MRLSLVLVLVAVGVGICHAADQEIFGGTVVEGGQAKYPWMVSLRSDSDKDFHFCGGQMIRKNVILTAAHCLHDQQNNKFEPASVAWFSIWSKAAGKAVLLHGKERVCHPQYDSSSIINDVCVVKVDNAPADVVTIDLPQDGNDPKVGEKCDSIGWGKTEKQEASAKLLHVSLPVTERSTCYDNHKSYFCAGEPNDDANKVKGTCSGDSGGPLFCKRDVGGSLKDVLYGVVSFGDRECLRYSAYASVAVLRQWINTEADKLAAGSGTNPAPGPAPGPSPGPSPTPGPEPEPTKGPEPTEEPGSETGCGTIASVIKAWFENSEEITANCNENQCKGSEYIEQEKYDFFVDPDYPEDFDHATCSPGVCTYSYYVCDGVDDCPNGEDEKGCTELYNRELRQG